MNVSEQCAIKPVLPARQPASGTFCLCSSAALVDAVVDLARGTTDNPKTHLVRRALRWLRQTTEQGEELSEAALMWSIGASCMA